MSSVACSERVTQGDKQQHRRQHRFKKKKKKNKYRQKKTNSDSGGEQTPDYSLAGTHHRPNPEVDNDDDVTDTMSNSRDAKIQAKLEEGGIGGFGGNGFGTVKQLRRAVVQMTIFYFLLMLGCSYALFTSPSVGDNLDGIKIMLAVCGPLLGLMVFINWVVYGRTIFDVLIMMTICMVCAYIIGWYSQIFAKPTTSLSDEDAALLLAFVAKLKSAKPA